MPTHYPTLEAAAEAACAECGGPAPAGPARTAHRFPGGWAILCPACSPTHYAAYRAARVAAETAERAARPKPPRTEPAAGQVCRTLTPNELWIQFGTPVPDRTFRKQRPRR